MITIWLENEYEGDDFSEVFDFDCQKTAEAAAAEVLRQAGCPFDAEVSLILTDDAEIQNVNRETRDLDRATDVLSFPAFQYSEPAAFEEAESDPAGAFDPETGNLLLGDIMISVDHVREQAKEYGHGTKREFAFLVAHSVLHLIGYDHMTEEEEKVMFEKQEQALTALGITRTKEQQEESHL
ncbi:MAG: rRNA maturation RNase YbeY [Lachnospiraceae bacterium]|nr:rRNA maturation RNase YbeY [Lachnospiraceae bacterium]